jgi:hypothetical protein
VTALRERRGHVAVELDGQAWRTVPLEVVVRAGLAVELELDRPRLRLLRRELRRAEALAAALTVDGYAATVRPAAGSGSGLQHLGAQLCQGHCPVQHVAREFPELCEAETDAFSRLLGVHVQRLATLAHGEHVCTTHIPTGHIPTGHIPTGHIPLTHLSATTVPPTSLTTGRQSE